MKMGFGEEKGSFSQRGSHSRPNYFVDHRWSLLDKTFYASEAGCRVERLAGMLNRRHIHMMLNQIAVFVTALAITFFRLAGCEETETRSGLADTSPGIRA
jgi:hypothetical protein